MNYLIEVIQSSLAHRLQNKYNHTESYIEILSIASEKNDEGFPPFICDEIRNPTLQNLARLPKQDLVKFPHNMTTDSEGAIDSATNTTNAKNEQDQSRSTGVTSSKLKHYVIQKQDGSKRFTRVYHSKQSIVENGHKSDHKPINVIQSNEEHKSIDIKRSDTVQLNGENKRIYIKRSVTKNSLQSK
jgi:hypothetical protein